MVRRHVRLTRFRVFRLLVVRLLPTPRAREVHGSLILKECRQQSLAVGRKFFDPIHFATLNLSHLNQDLELTGDDW